MSFHRKLVQYREYDINLFLIIPPHEASICKLVPIQYREFQYG